METFCPRCGIKTKSEGYCLQQDRNDSIISCSETMKPDSENKVACWCSSFPARQFKHPISRRLSPEVMRSIVINCLECEGSGRVYESENKTLDSGQHLTDGAV